MILQRSQGFVDDSLDRSSFGFPFAHALGDELFDDRGQGSAVGLGPDRHITHRLSVQTASLSARGVYAPIRSQIGVNGHAASFESD
ncbi:hypothetical protein D3C80_1399060 [compost metagenome]